MFNIALSSTDYARSSLSNPAKRKPPLNGVASL